jgi:hypothetical protein
MGTDCLLIEGGINKEGQLKMAARIAGMVHEIEGRPRYMEIKIGNESVRKEKDILGLGERDIVGFFNKRIGCDCLKYKHQVLRAPSSEENSRKDGNM